MNQTRAPGDLDIGSDTLLAAYQLLIETSVERGSDDELLQRSLAVVAAIRWPTSHRFFSACLLADDSGPLRLSAIATGSAASTAPSCADVDVATCLCSRALISSGRLHCIDAAHEAVHPPCDPEGTGTHLVLPLAARGRVLGVLHALAEPGCPPGRPERSFLIQVATLLGAELHRRRSEREHDRLEMQFLQAQKMEAVGRLAGGVAHDFNNILTAITNYADLGLLKLPAESPLRRNFEEIIAASDRAALLTQQLLAFSRRQRLSPRVIDANAILCELGKTLRRLLGADIEFSIATDPGLLRILADPALIEQLIINLMVSARDAMPHGGNIAVRTANADLDATYTLSHPTVAPGAYACITVSADAAGMAEALIAPDAAPRDISDGAALGPAAVVDIIRQAGGHAQIETANDSGTTVVRIYFPAVSDEVARTAALNVAYRMPQGSETILLAEDDDSVRIVMVEILRDLGYEVLEARNGREALALAADHAGRIDVLLTDVVMPGFSGTELYSRLAATRPDVRVLYVIGSADGSSPRDGLAESGAALLQKPFSPWALASRLRLLFDEPPPVPA